jgi:hypothetical protein
MFTARIASPVARTPERGVRLETWGTLGKDAATARRAGAGNRVAPLTA